LYFNPSLKECLRTIIWIKAEFTSGKIGTADMTQDLLIFPKGAIALNTYFRIEQLGKALKISS
jgi:hypothetical protein